MRRFIRTITARRHVNFFVIQDGDAHAFEILRWSAQEAAPVKVGSFSYQQEAASETEQPSALGETKDKARTKAIAEAQRLAKAESLQHEEAQQTERWSRSDEEASRLAQRMSPKQQEQQRVRRIGSGVL